MLRRRPEWSVRTRLTLLATLVMTLLCAGFSALILTNVHTERTNERSRRSHDANMRAITLLARGELSPVHAERGVAALQMIDPAGRIVSASPNLPRGSPMATFAPIAGRMGRTETLCDMPVSPGDCMLVSATIAPRHDGNWIGYAAAPAHPWYVSGRLLSGVLTGSVLLIGFTAAGAYRIVGRALKPVDTIRAQLSKITSTDLGHRVPVPGPRDEIHDLVCAVNQTLDLLEAALQRERRFTSDASHDLRSPITAMRAQMEEALLHPDEADWPVTVTSTLDSLQRLQAIVADLLTLSRLEAGCAAAFKPLDLSDLVTYELDHRRRPLTITRDLEPAMVHGAPIELIRLLTNLLDNAERHAAATVTVSVRAEDGQAVLTVTDDGPGIADGQRERVFQRFVRLDDARLKDINGTGLGLPIARQIAEQHGGTLTVEDCEQGARFVARIPLCHAQV
ncbi:ATP-binding protein [Nonomuraea sp. NPDC048882]|uniref:sensor histidine kinase n=1 Tax=Nonomuraea sp. NPDC048882 TaxID=3154347 RepID=UPI0033E2B0D9